MSNGHVDWDILKTTSTGLSHVLLGNRSTRSFYIFQHLFYVMTKLLISVVHVKKPFITVFNTILAIDMFTIHSDILFMSTGTFAIANLFITCRATLDNTYIDRWLWKLVALSSARLGAKHVACMWYKGYIRREKATLISINNIAKYWS